MFSCCCVSNEENLDADKLKHLLKLQKEGIRKAAIYYPLQMISRRTPLAAYCQPIMKM